MGHRGSSSPRGVISTLGYCGALVSISQSISLPLLPILPAELHTSASNVSWVATSAVLSAAIANPVMGRLGDMYGKRRMMITAMTIQLIGCILAALAPNVITLVAARALQGIGVAVLPIGMSLAKDLLPPDKAARGVAMVSATLGIGGGIGLPMAGLVVGWLNWQSVFWVTAALTVIGLAATVRLLPADTTRTPQPFDAIGACWLSACLVVILLPLSKTSAWGVLRPLPVALYVAGFAGLVGWYRYEQHPVRPLVDVALMRRRPMVLVNCAGLLLGFAMFSNLYASLNLLQTPKAVPHGFGLSVVSASLVLAPSAVAMMVTSPLSARITERHGARTSLWLGSVIIGVGYATFPLMLGSIVTIGLSVAFVNAGVGIAYGAMPSAIMAFVPSSETASANSIGTLSRATGASVSGAAVGAIFGSMTVVAAGKSVPTISAFRLVFVIAAAASFAAATIAQRLPRVAVGHDANQLVATLPST